MDDTVVSYFLLLLLFHDLCTTRMFAISSFGNIDILKLTPTHYKLCFASSVDSVGL